MGLAQDKLGHALWFTVKTVRLLGIVTSLVWASPSWAQLDLRLETSQSCFLQFAPIPIQVILKNFGAQPLQLGSQEEVPWLEVIVQSNDGLMIRPEKPLAPPTVTLAPGQSQTLPLDLAPHFLIREPGGYRARASVRLANGETLLTESLAFLVGRGEVVWSVPRGQGRDRRIFSLLRYYEDPNVGLYLRVELPEQNLVYPARRLGPYLPIGKPSAEFDDKNHLHILHVVAPGEYRVSVVNQDGRLLREELRQEGGQKPRLRRSPDGLIDVEGGTVILPSHLREKLSTLQARAGTGPAVP